MKTQMYSTLKKMLSALLVVALLGFAACSVRETDQDAGRDASPAPQQNVAPPGIDIHTATLMGDLKAIRQHIQAGTDLNEREPALGSTPLISAAVFGRTEVALALIEAGADVNLQNNEGSTALHSAAFLCRTEIVKALLENGADRNLLNNYGSTPLESVLAPWDAVKPIYDVFSRDLGPLGLKLDYGYIEKTRPVIAGMLQQ
jgi:hypothetical protein